MEHGVPDNLAQVLARVYEHYKPQLWHHLTSTGTSPMNTPFWGPNHRYPGIQAQQIVDIDWRLDHHIRSKNAGRDAVPVYFLSLKVPTSPVHRISDMCDVLYMMT